MWQNILLMQWSALLCQVNRKRGCAAYRTESTERKATDGMNRQMRSVFSTKVMSCSQHKGCGWLLTVLTMQHTAIFKLIRTPDFHTALPLYTRDITWAKKDRNLFNLYLIKEEKFLLFSAHLVSPAAAECSLCLLPELDPQPGGWTCWPAPWSASPAHHHLPAHSMEAQEACLGRRDLSICV